MKLKASKRFKKLLEVSKDKKTEKHYKEHFNKDWDVDLWD